MKVKILFNFQLTKCKKKKPPPSLKPEKRSKVYPKRLIGFGKNKLNGNGSCGVGIKPPRSDVGVVVGISWLMMLNGKGAGVVVVGAPKRPPILNCRFCLVCNSSPVTFVASSGDFITKAQTKLMPKISKTTIFKFMIIFDGHEFKLKLKFVIIRFLYQNVRQLTNAMVCTVTIVPAHFTRTAHAFDWEAFLIVK